MTPTRIQRSRKRGYKYPPGSVLTITRRTKDNPGPFGNPFRVCKRAGYQGWIVERDGVLVAFGFETKRLASRFAIDRFREYLAERKEKEPSLYFWSLEAVRQADHLACFCPLDVECHGDIWIELAAQ